MPPATRPESHILELVFDFAECSRTSSSARAEAARQARVGDHLHLRTAEQPLPPRRAHTRQPFALHELTHPRAANAEKLTGLLGRHPVGDAVIGRVWFPTAPALHRHLFDFFPAQLPVQAGLPAQQTLGDQPVHGRDMTPQDVRSLSLSDFQGRSEAEGHTQDRRQDAATPAQLIHRGEGEFQVAGGATRSPGAAAQTGTRIRKGCDE